MLMGNTREYEVWRMNAFTDKPFSGNPAAVVYDADDLSDQSMQLIAPELNSISETVFVSQALDPSADIRLRYFTSTTEVDLCGHATISALFALVTSNRITGDTGVQILHAETRVGTLELGLIFNDGQLDWATMTQLKPKFAQPTKPECIPEILGISSESIRSDLTVACCSTGIWSCYVPLINLDALGTIRIQSKLIENLWPENQELAGIYPFVITDINKASGDLVTQGRFFSPPKYGIEEDPVTGTACGALGGHLINQGILDRNAVLLARQGLEMGRAGLVRVEQESNGAMRISGKAIPILRGKVTI
jgi:PhzF family phenazine biosynthesis protein